MTLGERLRAEAARLRAARVGDGAGPLSDSQAWQWIVRVFEATTGMGAVERTLSEAAPAADVDLRQFDLAVARLAAGEPLAYVVGEQFFMGRRFSVTPAVLIPRDDTAVLVGAALDAVGADRSARILDLGTGSGCVAISIALERPRSDVVAIDSAAAALDIARDNARRLGATNVRFACAHWFAGAPPGPFDLVVANPPYIETGNPHLAALAHEPASALVSGRDGLDDLRRIVSGAGAVLAPDGLLLVEHGYRQRPAVVALFEAAGFTGIAVLDDAGDNPRVVHGRRADSVRSAGC